MANQSSKVWLLLAVSISMICFSFGEIHRAKSPKTKQPSRQVPYTDYQVWPPGALVGPQNEETVEYYPKLATKPRQTLEERSSFITYNRETWLYSMLSAILVGLSGIFPLLVIPLEAGKALRHGAAAERLKLLLSFAVGGLLGDVFLHLLPEAWANIDLASAHEGHTRIGLWVLTGIFSFLIIEKAFPDNEEGESEQEEDDEEEEKEEVNTEEFSKEDILHALKNTLADKEGMVLQRRKPCVIHSDTPDNLSNGDCATHILENGDVKGKSCKDLKNSLIQAKKSSPDKHSHQTGVQGDICEEPSQIKTIGWLNLMANVIDNFTHGLAVAGSYCVSTKTGVLTTVAILLHEVPHEIGDFAILLRAGFDRWKAAKAQLLTATGGLLGAITALSAESTEVAGNKTAWVLPFTAGGFIYISLVTIVPDLIKERNPLTSMKQVALLLLGVSTMALVTEIFDD